MKILHKHTVKIFAYFLLLLVVFGALPVFSAYNGIILLHNPSDAAYPIKGVDVSSYQGDKGKERFIDMNVFYGSEEAFLLYPKKFTKEV